MDNLQFIICSILLIYLLFAGYLFFFQRSIIYVPSKQMGTPQNYGLNKANEVKLTTPDNIKIIAWHIFKDKNRPTLLYFHGNAGNLGDRAIKIQEFVNNGFNVFALSYRGYGKSAGEPSEEGLYFDARTAIEYLINNNTPENKMVFYGESLGSGVAVQMATEYDPAAIILEAPYTSLGDRGAELYPYIPVKLLIQDTFNSKEKIGDVTTATLIFHGERDDVMPIEHGRKILELANEPKEAHFFEHYAHNDFDSSELAQLAIEFVKKHLTRD